MIEGGTPIPLARTQPPILVVISDTEEEFDWNAPFDRNRTSVAAMADIHRAQDLCDAFELKPCYVIDYPIASQSGGYGPLREFHQAGHCEIGAHLHPWVNPPHDEEVSARNSLPGNLPPALEREKIAVLNRAIEEHIGQPGVVYKAGRYGLGPQTRATLRELGFTIDASPAPPYDLSDKAGPDYSRFPLGPSWVGKLLSLPCTGAFVGYLNGGARPLYRLATARPLQWARLPGILSRTGALDRLRLTPEGFSLSDNIRLARSLLRRGERVLTYSFHSPSMRPGCTPYVRTDADLERFLDSMRGFFRFWKEEVQGIGMTPSEVRQHILDAASPEVPHEGSRRITA